MASESDIEKWAESGKQMMQLEKGQAFKTGSVHDPVDWVPICKAFRHAVNELADFMSYRIQFFYPNAYADVMTTL